MPGDYYFFCLSYNNIPAILSIIEKLNSTDANVHIIVHIESHRLFWQELVRSKYLPWRVIFLNTVAGSLKNPLSWLEFRQSVRRMFKMYFQALHDAHIYFFSLSPPLEVLALINLLTRKNSIYFLDCDRKVFPKWHNLRNSIYRLLLHFLYGIDVDMVRINYGAAPFIGRGFIKKAKVQQLIRQDYQDYYDMGILKKYDFVDSEIKAGKHIVVLEEVVVTAAYLKSREAYYEMLNTLKKVIESNFSRGEVLFKRHPNPVFHTKDFDPIYGDYLEYPYYVPADFIFLDPNIRFVVGGLSTTLASAARYFNVKSISYLKLVPFHDEDFKANMIEMQRSESDNKIAFPDSWEELNSLLSCSTED